MQEKPPKKQYRETLHLWLQRISEKLEHYSNLISLFTSIVVAFATIALAIITYFQINESREMRIETKRLVDTGIEQFKIKSYPDLSIVFKPLSYQSNKVIQILEIHNQGEITAYNVAHLLVNIYEKDSQTGFENLLFAKGNESEEERNGLTFKFNISPRMFKFLQFQKSITGKWTPDSLKGAVLFIRFEVPYDTKYRYKAVAYGIKKDMSSKESGPIYMMSEMDSIYSNYWIKRYMAALQSMQYPNATDIKTFLKDYEPEYK